MCNKIESLKCLINKNNNESHKTSVRYIDCSVKPKNPNDLL